MSRLPASFRKSLGEPVEGQESGRRARSPPAFRSGKETWVVEVLGEQCDGSQGGGERSEMFFIVKIKHLNTMNTPSAMRKVKLSTKKCSR